MGPEGRGAEIAASDDVESGFVNSDGALMCWRTDSTLPEFWRDDLGELCFIGFQTR